MDMGYTLHFIDLLAKLYRKQFAKVKVAGTLSEWFSVKKGIRPVAAPAFDDWGPVGYVASKVCGAYRYEP